MKTLNEYLLESKKVYQFKVKIADDLPEGFEAKFKTALEKFSVGSFEKVKTTPIQESPIDFPNHKNTTVTIFDISLNYPVTSPQITNVINADLRIPESCIRVRGAFEDEPSIDEVMTNKKEKALLDSPYEKGVKAKDYFGDAFNKSFLKDLEKAAKTRKKDAGQKDIKTDAKDAGPDYGQSSPSPIGSK
jgi:hypothetical protein